MLVIIVSLVWVAIIILIKVGDKNKGKEKGMVGDKNKGKDDEGKDDEGKDDEGKDKGDESDESDDSDRDDDDDSQVFIISFSIVNLFYESFL